MLPVVYKNFFKHLKKLSILSLLSFFSLSCALIPKEPSSSFEKEIKKDFTENYDILWKVIQQSFQKYPIKNTDYEKGLISTQWIRLNSLWKDPSLKNKTPSYQIRIHIIKHLNSKTITVKIKKQIKNKKNFFTEEINLLSNLIEEKIILYRIIQELKIYKKLNPTL